MNHSRTMNLLKIEDEERKGKIEFVLNELRFILAVISSSNPRREFNLDDFKGKG